MRTSRRLVSLCAATGLVADGLFATTTASAAARRDDVCLLDVYLPLEGGGRS